jgi:hypothetical protein
MRKQIRVLIQNLEGLTTLDRVAGPAAGWVSRATRPDTVKDVLSGTWLGHQLHPMLTDLPIGAWAMASFLDLTAGRAGAGPARRSLASAWSRRCPRPRAELPTGPTRMVRRNGSASCTRWPT